MKARAFIILPLAVMLCCCGDGTSTSPQPAVPQMPTQLDNADTQHFSGNNAYVHCAALCALGPRVSGTPAYQRQLEYIESQLSAAGWRTFRDDFSAPNGTPMVNLRATFGGADTTRAILLSCHIDTKSGIENFVSADDGASGAAVLLEVARILAADEKLAARVELVFLDGEEAFAPRMSEQDGLYGSKHDVARRKGALPKFQINLDMVGGGSNTIAIPALDTSQFMFEQYTAAIAACRLNPERWTAYPGSYMDDHQPYLRAGVDTLNLIALFREGNWWHTPRDNMDRISPRKLEESGSITLQLIRQLVEK